MERVSINRIIQIILNTLGNDHLDTDLNKTF